MLLGPKMYNNIPTDIREIDCVKNFADTVTQRGQYQDSTFIFNHEYKI